jgi:hypothetical protein
VIHPCGDILLRAQPDEQREEIGEYGEQKEHCVRDHIAAVQECVHQERDRILQKVGERTHKDRQAPQQAKVLKAESIVVWERREERYQCVETVVKMDAVQRTHTHTHSLTHTYRQTDRQTDRQTLLRIINLHDTVIGCGGAVETWPIDGKDHKAHTLHPEHREE